MMEIAEDRQTFWEHCDALRYVLFKMIGIIVLGMVFGWIFHAQIISFLTRSFTTISQKQLLILGPTEGMLASFNVSFWISITGTAPLWMLFLLQFFLPALKSKEKRFVLPFFLATLLFMFLGALFSVYLMIPLANRFLYLFNEGLGLNLWSLSQYLSYTLCLLFSTIFAFECFLFFFFCIHYGKISAATLRRKRRIAIVIIFIVSALLTPPDVFTQCLLAVPLLILYEGSILYASIRIRYEKEGLRCK